MGFQEFFDLFQRDFPITLSVVNLSIAWLIAFGIGYYLMSSQVKLVKKEIWKFRDSIKCVIFGIFFAMGFIIIIAMMETIILETQDMVYDGQAPYILYPILICLIFITIYPLFDFLFMAKSETELSVIPVQKPFEKLIKSVKKPYTYLVALGLYLVVFILPLFLFGLLTKIPMFIYWVSWMLIYPMLILSYYASIGYVRGFWILYSRIPEMERSTFLAFDAEKRGFKEFLRDPMTRIVWGTLIWTYVYTPVVVVRTLRRLSMNFDIMYHIAQHSFDWYLPIALGFAVSTFFSRYWKRKVKVSTRSILFSAFLIAAVGINILINYTIARPDLFREIYMRWDFTSVLYDVRGTGTAGEILNYSQLNLIGVIEELVICIVINYYFLVEKNKTTIYETMKTSVRDACEKFNPIPGFNMIRYKKPEYRQYAKENLIQMYERIPFKRSSFSEITYKNPLMDALCDPTNFYAQKTAKEIIIRLIDTYPLQCVELIQDALDSSNFDKAFNMTEILIKSSKNLNQVITTENLLDLIHHPSFLIQLNAVKLISLLVGDKTSSDVSLSKQDLEILTKLLDSSDYELEIEILRLLSHFPDQVPIECFLNRIHSPNIEIQSVSTEALSNYERIDFKTLSLDELQRFLTNPNAKIVASTLKTIGAIGNFEKNKIDPDIFLSRIIHANPDIRRVAIEGMKSYLSEKPRAVKPIYFINLLENSSYDSLDTTTGILTLLSEIWHVRSAKVLPVFIKYLKSTNMELSKVSQAALIEMGKKNPKTIVKILIQEEDTASFIKKGKIAETIIQIGEFAWKGIIPILYTNLTSEINHIRKNSAVILNSFAKTHAKELSFEKILDQWKIEEEVKIQKELTFSLISFASNSPQLIKPYLSTVFAIFQSANEIQQVTMVEIFKAISDTQSKMLTTDLIETVLQNKASKVREIGVHILGNYYVNDPKFVLKQLITTLEDRDWSVQNIAAETIASLGIQNLDKNLIKKIKK